MKIATWNVNSILARMQNLLDWLSVSRPDILMLQEIRCQDHDFPKEYLENFGYNISVHGEKGSNGVAIMSKFPIEEVVHTSLPACPLLPGKTELDARYLEILVDAEDYPLRVATVYVPNGGDVSMETTGQKLNETPRFLYKMSFLDALYAHLAANLQYDEPFIIGGDFNICPELIDVYTPSKDGDICCHIDERRKFRALKNLGYSDVYRELHPQQQAFSWWGYRHNAWEKNQGMRLDHFLASPMAMDKIQQADIEAALTRGEKKPSDHVPVTCVL